MPQLRAAALCTSEETRAGAEHQKGFLFPTFLLWMLQIKGIIMSDLSTAEHSP